MRTYQYFARNYSLNYEALNDRSAIYTYRKRERTMKNSWYMKIIAILTTVVLIAFLFTEISPNDIISTLLAINPVFVLAGFVLYIWMYFLRAWRFHILLNNEVTTRDLFSIECVHNMLNNLLPARTGELSYVYLLKTEHTKTTGDALGTLIIARIFDFIIITIFFLLLFLFIGDLAPGFMTVVVIGIVFLLSMVVLLIGLLSWGDSILLRVKKLSGYIDFKRIRLGTYIVKKSEETLACFRTYKAGKIHRHLSVILLSAGIWASTYLLFYLIALSMNIGLGSVQILFASSFVVFSSVLPIQGIGGFGTVEGGWALGFIAVGAAKDVAINTGFGYHLIILVYTIFLGTLGYLKISRSRKRKERED